MSFFHSNTDINVAEICENEAEIDASIQSGNNDAHLVQTFTIAAKKLGLKIPKKFHGKDGEKLLGEKLRADLAGTSSELTGLWRVVLPYLKVHRSKSVIGKATLEAFLLSKNPGHATADTAIQAQSKVMKVLDTFIERDEGSFFATDDLKRIDAFTAKLSEVPDAERQGALEKELKSVEKRSNRVFVVQALKKAKADGLVSDDVLAKFLSKKEIG